MATLPIANARRVIMQLRPYGTNAPASRGHGQQGRRNVVRGPRPGARLLPLWTGQIYKRWQELYAGMEGVSRAFEGWRGQSQPNARRGSGQPAPAVRRGVVKPQEIGM